MSTPSASINSALRPGDVSWRGSVPGANTSRGCRSNVTAMDGRPRSRAIDTVRVMTAWWPRWTPSKNPTVTTVGPSGRWQRADAANDLHGGQGTGTGQDELGDGLRAVVVVDADQAAVGAVHAVRARDARRAEEAAVGRGRASSGCRSPTAGAHGGRPGSGVRGPPAAGRPRRGTARSPCGEARSGARRSPAPRPRRPRASGRTFRPSTAPEVERRRRRTTSSSNDVDADPPRGAPERLAAPRGARTAARPPP